MKKLKICFSGNEILRNGLTELQADLPFTLAENDYSDGAVLAVEAVRKNVGNGFIIEKNDDKATIYYRKFSDFYYALTELLLHGNGDYQQSGECSLEDFGLMVDCSRNAVLKIDSLKRLIRETAKLGYNYLMLYTEDTLQIDGEPYFGYKRGRYTPAEIGEVAAYAEIFGIELIPHIQTLGHLGAMFKNSAYANVKDYDNVLLAKSEETYRLLENVIKSVAKTFRSNKIHIGMDEVFMLGAGNYRKRYGYEGEKAIYTDHFERVQQLCLKYGFEKIYFYSDCLFRMLSGTKGHYSEEANEFSVWENSFKEHLYPVYWDYYSESEARYEKAIQEHRKFSKNVVFATGAWKWIGFAPSNEQTEKRAVPAMKAVKKTGVKDMFVTAWGDDGGEASVYSVLPSLLLCSEFMYGNEERGAHSEEKSAFLWGYTLKQFRALDTANAVRQNCVFHGCYGSVSKIAFYEDMLLGIASGYLPLNASRDFAAAAQNLAALSKKKSGYAYLFKTLSKLCDFNALKSRLEREIYAAYHRRAYDAMQKIVKQFGDLKRKELAFYNAFDKQWHLENKSVGFEIQNIRFGGVRQSLDYTEKRLRLWSEGKLEKIEELEEDRLPFDPNNVDLYDSFLPWTDIVSKNYICRQ